MIGVPLLESIIEKYGDGLLDDSLMSVGWPLHLNGAVKQWCVHRTATFQELAGLLKTYNIKEYKRDLIELNSNAAQWKVGAVWNRFYMETETRKSMRQMWRDQKSDMKKSKVTDLRKVEESDILRATDELFMSLK